MRTRRLIPAAFAAIAFALALGACGAPAATETPEGGVETTESTATLPTTTKEYLDLSSETGSAWAVSAWSVTGDGWSTEATNTYDDAGNLTSQRTVGRQPGSESTQTVTYTYTDNLLVKRDATMGIAGVESTIGGEYGEPEFIVDGETAELIYTGYGDDGESGLSYVWESAYSLEDDGLSVEEWAEDSKVSVPGATDAEGESPDSETTDITMNQTVVFDAEGRATRIDSNVNGADISLTLTYADGTLGVAGDQEETWTYETNSDGLITKLTKDDTTIELSYTELKAPTNFNRALAKTSSGQAIVYALTASIASQLFA